MRTQWRGFGAESAGARTSSTRPGSRAVPATGIFPPVAYAERHYGGMGDPWAPQDAKASPGADPAWDCRPRAGDTLALREPVPPPPPAPVPVRRRRGPLRLLVRAVVVTGLLVALLGAVVLFAPVPLPGDPGDIRIGELRPWLDETRARVEEAVDRIHQ